MWFEPIFFTGSSAVFIKERGEPACGRAAKSQGLVFAAFGGEMRSNYFQYRAFSKSQRFIGRLASLGGFLWLAISEMVRPDGIEPSTYCL